MKLYLLSSIIKVSIIILTSILVAHTDWTVKIDYQYYIVLRLVYGLVNSKGEVVIKEHENMQSDAVQCNRIALRNLFSRIIFKCDNASVFLALVIYRQEWLSYLYWSFQWFEQIYHFARHWQIKKTVTTAKHGCPNYSAQQCCTMLTSSEQAFT
jgi:hypothetical protein